MFKAIAKPMASALAFFYGLVPNYAVAIILLTVLVMLFLTPFTVKSTRSMLAMQRLQPELKRLQAEHKNDRQALNEAMMAFYKEHNVNPLSGCLPMLLQMPVFFALYEAIRGVTRNPPELSKGSDMFKALCPNFSELANACGGGEKGFVVQMKVFGVDLAEKVSSNHGSFVKGLPFYLLIVATTLTQYYQQRQISNRNPGAAQANPQMQMMQKFFPLIFLVIYINIPAAVVMYFLTSNLLRIAQQGAMWKWDPKLAAEVSKDKSEIESNTRIIDAKSKQVGKTQKPGVKPEGRPGGKPSAGKQPGKGSSAGELDPGSNGRSGGSGSGSGSGARGSSGSGGSGKPNVVKPSGQSGKPGRPPTGAGPGSRQRGPRRGR